MLTLKKIATFIASRALYFVFGVLIAVGSTYAYATWDQARTINNANPNELTKDNWNELVTMVENNVGAGGSGSPYIDYNDCESNRNWVNCSIAEIKNLNIVCSAGYSLVDSICAGYSCYLNHVDSLHIMCNNMNRSVGSIKCCKFVIP